MTAISTWCTENNMSVNPDKTAIQSFSLTHRQIRPNVRFQDSSKSFTDQFKYLGFTFDNKLNWSLHVDSLLKRSHQRLTILKRLAGSTWGCVRTTLNLTYKTFILPLILYCCEPLVTANEQVLKRIECFHNQAMRLITGGVKTTPIDSLLLLTNNTPVRTSIKERAAILFEKLIRIGVPFWANYQDAKRNLKTQCGFYQKVKDMAVELDLDERRQEVIPPINPLSMTKIQINLNLVKAVSKSETNPEILKSLALETIYNDYPEENWLHVYTDGSFFSETMSAGAGVYSEIFSFYASAGKNRNAFDGEVEALKIALEQLLFLHYKFDKVVLLSDSSAAIQAIASIEAPLSREILKCREYLSCLVQKNKTVKLQWIPGHCGIYGNEQADSLARKGALLPQPARPPLPLSSSKLNIKRSLRQQHLKNVLDRTESKSWKVDDLLGLPERPRRTAVAQFRLLVGHDCLAEHLHRMNLLDSPFCPLCKSREIMNRKHLANCQALRGHDSETSRYWRARHLLRQ